MAVAGSRKGSILDSYLNENHSSASRRYGNKERSTTQTSSIRKMWRDLESEGRIVNEIENTSIDPNEIENKCPQNQNQNQNQISVENGQEDDNRLRVRKIFHEWGSKSCVGHTRMNNRSRAQWDGENEFKRVRIVKDWIESSTQQRDTCQTGVQEPVTEIVTQIARIRNGSVDCEGGVRRSIRRIYGRQAHIELLTKFKKERESDVEGLLENRFVTNFAHRNRIQALLKGRFLLNQRFVESEKKTSVAASELGLLRQSHSVSDIRKGFLSRLNNNDHAPESAQSDSDTSSEDGMTYDHIEQAEEIVNITTDEIREEFETSNLTSNRESQNPQQFTSPAVEIQHANLQQYEEREKSPLTVEHAPEFDQSGSDTSSENEMTYDHIQQAEESVHEITNETVEELEIASRVGEGHEQNDSAEISQNNYRIQLSQDTFNWQDASTETEERQESVTEDDDSGWNQLSPIESDEGVIVNSNENQHEWYTNVLVDATESRSDAFYWSDDDDDNGRRIELNELTNRRRVSNLLESDFGTRLNQLLQSYLDRQDEAYESEDEWMLQEQHTVDENATLPSLVRQSQEHIGTEREIINGLRIDMDTIQKKMNDMQRMLEACMNMQLEMQRSMQQEVYSALNRSSTSRGKEGGCYLCCKDGFESLPNRSAHMCICSKCAEKINWSKLKESVNHP